MVVVVGVFLVELLRVDVLDKDIDTTDDEDVDATDDEEVDATDDEDIDATDDEDVNTIDNDVNEDADATEQISTSTSLEMATAGYGRSDKTKGSSKQRQPAGCPFGLETS